MKTTYPDWLGPLLIVIGLGLILLAPSIANAIFPTH